MKYLFRTSLDAEKAGQNLTPFLIKPLSKRIERNFLSMIRPMYEQLTANIKLNGERMKAFPSRSGTRHFH